MTLALNRARMLVVAAGLVAIAGLALPSPADAHGGHGSCSQGADVFNTSADRGTLASTTGRTGTTDEGIEALHTVTCEPNP